MDLPLPSGDPSRGLLWIGAMSGFYWYSLVHSKQEAVQSMSHALDPFKVKQTVEWIDIYKQKKYVNIVYMTFNVMLLINYKARIKCSFWFLMQLYLVVYLIPSCYLICDFVIFFDILVLLKACLSMKRKVLSNNLSLLTVMITGHSSTCL